MKILDETGLSTLWSKIKSLFIQSDTVRKIVIVDEYPEVEEEGVLYLKKGTSSEGGETEETVNLYYQETDKNYTSSSSGYSCNWSTTNTVNPNSDTYMIKDAERSSNNFSLTLKANTTYKLVFNYISGNALKEDNTVGKINYSLWNADTEVKIIDKTVECGNNGEVTFTAENDETINAEMQLYLYTGVHYDNVYYEIGLYEVKA